jgi:carboxymethylenebutenolidase
VARIDVQIPTPDGTCPATLHVPEGDGPWPGVVLFPDAGGARETMRVMADRLARTGYVTLVPDVYYREGAWTPFDIATSTSCWRAPRSPAPRPGQPATAWVGGCR